MKLTAYIHRGTSTIADLRAYSQWVWEFLATKEMIKFFAHVFTHSYWLGLCKHKRQRALTKMSISFSSQDIVILSGIDPNNLILRNQRVFVHFGLFKQQRYSTIMANGSIDRSQTNEQTQVLTNMHPPLYYYLHFTHSFSAVVHPHKRRLHVLFLAFLGWGI